MFTITENCEISLLNTIEKYLIKRSTNGKIPKLYFSGEYDSNQTKFEYASNNLEIAVQSDSKTVGLVLLRLLRIIIDKGPELLMMDVCTSWEEVSLEDGGYDEIEIIVENGDEIKISDIISRLAKKEKTYMQSFTIGRTISTNFIGGNNFTKDKDDIDIWDLSRIMKAIKKLY